MVPLRGVGETWTETSTIDQPQKMILSMNKSCRLSYERSRRREPPGARIPDTPESSMKLLYEAKLGF